MPSSVIRSFWYDRAKQQLTIQFVSGRRYCYADVPPAIHDAMSKSFSKGEYFNAHIRDHFSFEKEA